MNNCRFVAACQVAAVLMVSGAVMADFIGAELELVAAGITHFGPIGSFENRDVVRLYAQFVPGSDAQVVAWGASIQGGAAHIDNSTCSGAKVVPGTGFWKYVVQISALPLVAGTLFDLDPEAGQYSSYFTIGNEAGYEPAIEPTTGVPYEMQLSPGFNPNLAGTTSVNLTGGVVLADPGSPYGLPDATGRVLLAQLNIASGEFVHGVVNVMLQDGTAIEGIFFGPLNPCDIVPCPGDLNGDLVVDVFDLLALLSSWGPCPGCEADLNGDGVVDVFDLLALLAAWGPCE